MKRAAEMQLTLDIANIKQEDQEDFRLFQQADEATLAARKIRSLPCRHGLGGQSGGQRTSSSQSQVRPLPKGDERTIKEEESQQPSMSKFGVTTKRMKDGRSRFSCGALPGVKPISSFGGLGASSGTSDFKFGFGATQTTTGATKQPFSVGFPAPGTTRPPEKNQESSVSIASKPAFSFGLPPPSSTTPPTSGPRPSFSFRPPPGAINAPMSTSNPVPNEKQLAGGGGFSIGHLPGSMPTKSSYSSTSSAAVEAAVQALRKLLVDLGKKLDLQGRKTQSWPDGKKSKGKKGKGKKGKSAPTRKQRAGKVKAAQKAIKTKKAGKVKATQKATKTRTAGKVMAAQKAIKTKKAGKVKAAQKATKTKTSGKVTAAQKATKTKRARKVKAAQKATKTKKTRKVTAAQKGTKTKKAGGPSPKNKTKDNKKKGGKK